MNQDIETKLDFKDKLVNFYNLNKGKVFIFVIILLTALILVFFFYNKALKKNIFISEKYVQAGLYLATKDNKNAKALYEEIILSKNKFYSILALNTIIEKNLIKDKSKILDYFEILDKSISSKNEKDLIIFKKALYLLKISDIKNGNKILKKLSDGNSSLKPIIQEILID